MMLRRKKENQYIQMKNQFKNARSETKQLLKLYILKKIEIRVFAPNATKKMNLVVWIQVREIQRKRKAIEIA